MSQQPRRAPTRMHLGDHVHPVDELTWIHEGRAVVTIEGRTLIATRDQAVYVPAGANHRAHVPAGSHVTPVFLPGVHRLGLRAHRIARTARLDSLVAAVLDPASATTLPGASERLMTELATTARFAAPPWPSDPRARAVAEAVRADPGAATGLRELAVAAGVSERTLQRAFTSDTGMPFSTWMGRYRLAVGARLLREGRPVAEAASAVGYTPSAFIARYRRDFGTTPGREARAQLAGA